MEYALVGGPDSGTTLRLDYRAFAYAGKFVVGAPGKAVLRTSDGSPAVPEWEPDEPLPPTVEASEFDDDVVAAILLVGPNRPRLLSPPIRHRPRRAPRWGLGPRLIDRTVARLAADGYDRVKIAVNNSFAYAALYKCGFAYTGENTGIAELVLERSAGAGRREGTTTSGGRYWRDWTRASATATVTSIRRNGSSSQRDWGSAGERRERRAQGVAGPLV